MKVSLNKQTLSEIGSSKRVRKFVLLSCQINAKVSKLKSTCVYSKLWNCKKFKTDILRAKIMHCTS